MKTGKHIRLATGLALVLGLATAQADVVAVVSAKSPIGELSRNQVIDIFLGKRTRFPDGSAAVPIDQTEGSAARGEFYSRFASMTPSQIKAYWSKIIFTGRGQPPRALPNDGEVRKMVASNPNAIS